MSRLPRYLYHGTPAKNVHSICERGILRGTADRCGEISREAGFVQDCIGNVSLSVDKKDAIFFAVAHGVRSVRGLSDPYVKHGLRMQVREGSGFITPQAIFKVDTKRFDSDYCFRRELFGEGKAEVKCAIDIPPTAISQIHLRIPKRVDGKLKMVNQYRTCEETPVVHR